MRHYITKATHHLKFWEFQGSNDGENWKCLKKHSDDSSLKGISKSFTWQLSDDVDEYYSFFRIWVTGATDYGNWNLTCSGMELYGEWCELEEVKQETDPEIAKQTEKIEKSGFDSVDQVQFSIYKRMINGKSRKSSFNNLVKHSSTGSYNGSHPASLMQTSSINENEEQ